MMPDNCECCPLEIGDGADCKRSRYDDEKQEVVPGSQCPFALLAAKERECERLREEGRVIIRLAMGPCDESGRDMYNAACQVFACALAEGEDHAGLHYHIAYRHSGPYDKCEQPICKLNRAAIAEGGEG